MADTVDAATATIVVVVSTNDLEEAKKIGDATGDAYDSANKIYDAAKDPEYIDPGDVPPLKEPGETSPSG